VKINPSIFKNKQIVIVGLRGTGKTTFCRWLMQYYPRHLALDFYSERTQTEKGIMLRGGEYTGYNRYCVSAKEYGEALEKEFNAIATRAIASKKVDLLIIDEANRIAPNHHPLPNMAMELVDKSRGFNRKGTEATHGMAVVWAARRLAQLNTDIVELADWVIAFKQTGKNDLIRLNELHEGLADIMRKEITAEAHNFIITDGNNYAVEKIRQQAEPIKQP